jgi:MBG domain (YGX type)/Bacterial Ig-like domain (group 3)
VAAVQPPTRTRLLQLPAESLVPAGSVEFLVDGVSIGSATLVDGIATLDVANLAAGTHSVIAHYLGDDNFGTSESDPLSQVVGQVTLTVTAPSPSRPYGTANPELTPAITGFITGDDASVLDTAPTCTTTADAARPVGAYPVTCSGGADTNYAFAYVAGSLSVGQVTQAITFGALSNKTYGDPVFAVSATASSGLAVSFTSTTTGVCSVSIDGRVSIAGIGTCMVTASQPGDTNYVPATPVSRSFTVTKATTKTVVVGSPNSSTFGQDSDAHRHRDLCRRHAGRQRHVQGRHDDPVHRDAQHVRHRHQHDEQPARRQPHDQRHLRRQHELLLERGLGHPGGQEAEEVMGYRSRADRGPARTVIRPRAGETRPRSSTAGGAAAALRRSWQAA